MIHVVLRVLLVASLLVSGRSVLHRLVALRIVADRGGVEGRALALAWDPENAQLYHAIGVRYLKRPELDDPKLALAALERAVSLNPYSPRFRLDLAHAYEINGLSELAGSSFQSAADLKPGSPDYRWALANFHARVGDLEAALPHLRAALEVPPLWDWDHALRRTSYQLLKNFDASKQQIDRAWPDDTASRCVLLELLTEDEDSEIDFDFRYALWARLLEPTTPISMVDGAFFVRYLLHTDRIDLAREEWIRLARANGVVDESFEEKRNYVWNGTLELPITEDGHPLDWRLLGNPMFSVRQVAGEGLGKSSALRIDFPGNANLDFVTEVTIVVDPGADYELGLSVRSLDLTTDQGVYVEIRDAARQPLAETVQVRGTMPYHDLTAAFHVPEENRLLTLRVRRRPSRRIDNKLGGTVWLDSLRLSRVAADGLESAQSGRASRPGRL